MKPVNITPLKDFLEADITPEEFCECLDEIYFACSQQGMKNCDMLSEKVIDGLYYIHRLKKVLEMCC